MNNFAITAMGRSGTRFLAHTMNQSKRWMVAHEPSMFGDNPRGWCGHALVANPAIVNDRLNQRDYYGEVNSFLRHVLLDLDVAQRGVLLRDPHDILVSALNWSKKPGVSKGRVDMIGLGFMAMDRAIEDDEDVRVIRFEEITTSVTTLQAVLTDFGIRDVKVTQATLAAKVNAPVRYRVKTYQDVAAPIRGYYEAQTAWFREKYYAAT
jgi:hypothetical protein